jgi:hypothetical protein
VAWRTFSVTPRRTRTPGTQAAVAPHDRLAGARRPRASGRQAWDAWLNLRTGEGRLRVLPDRPEYARSATTALTIDASFATMPVPRHACALGRARCPKADAGIAQCGDDPPAGAAVQPLGRRRFPDDVFSPSLTQTRVAVAAMVADHPARQCPDQDRNAKVLRASGVPQAAAERR